MAAAQDLGDVEMLAILAAIGVAGYIGYQIYQGWKNGPGSIAHDIAAGAAAVADNVTGDSDPIVAGWDNLVSAFEDPMGNSMVGGGTVTDSQGNTAAY